MLTTKRALVFALSAYIATFIFAIPASIISGFDPTKVASPPASYCVAIIIFSTIVSAVSSYLYFTYKSPKIKAGTKDGFRFGITLIVLGFVLDMLLFLPFVISSGNLKQLTSSYGQWYVYAVFVGVLAGATGVGYWLEKNPKK